MSVCAEVQSAKPIANAVEIPAPASTRGEPSSGEILWVWTDTSAPSNSFFIPLSMAARPFAPPRLISDESTDSGDWVTYEYPWVTEEVAGFMSGEIQWPEVDLEY